MIWAGIWRTNSGRSRWVKSPLLLTISLILMVGWQSRVVISAPMVATAVQISADDVTDELVQPIADNLAADELIRVTAETLLEDIRQNHAVYDQDSSALYSKVRDWVLPHFDFQRISGYVLGSVWKQSDAELQERFKTEFSTLMLHTYGSALLAFQDQQIEFLPFVAKPGSSMATVKTQVVAQDGTVIPIDYRLGNHSGRWKVLDVKIDGISMVKTYRSEYGSIVKRDGIDSLISALAQRNQRNL